MSYPVKIVVSGPVGAGKTAYIQSLSTIPVVSTDEVSSVYIGKKLTTVAFDYGIFPIGDFEIHLFGTPGQERFDYMWDVLCEGAMGLLLLIDGSKTRDFPMAQKILDFILSRIEIPCVLGVTHQDAKNCWALGEIADYFKVPPELVMPVDPRNPADCLEALYALFEIINRKNSEVKT